MAAKSLTIGIVILERSRMGSSMDVPEPRLPQDGWGRRFMDKRLWYLIAGTLVPGSLAVPLGPLSTSIGNFRALPSPLSAGCIVFAALFLVENLAAIYFYLAMSTWTGSGNYAIPMLVLNGAELVGFAT